MRVAERDVGDQEHCRREADGMTAGFYFDGAARVEDSAYSCRSGQVAFDSCCHWDGSCQAVCIERQAKRARESGTVGYFDACFDGEVDVGANTVCDMHPEDISRGPPAGERDVLDPPVGREPRG